MAVRQSTVLCRACRNLKPRESFITIYPKNGKPHRGTTCDDCRASWLTPDLPGEEWRAAVGYEGHYEVSNCARVRRASSGKGTFVGKVLAQPRNNMGYPMVRLWCDGVEHQELVHRLVALAFLGPCPDGHIVHHKNGVRHDPLPANLEYRTQSDNVRDAYTSGRRGPRGRDIHPRTRARR